MSGSTAPQNAAGLAARPAVVCGVDWSRRCWRALRLADALAARSGLPLEVVHVTSPAPERVRRERGERLHEGIRGVLGRAGVPLTLEEGVPAERLEAASRRAALVVIGTRRRGAVRQKLGASVSAALTRRSACPVVVVPPKARHGAAADLGGTVLCGVRDERDLACAATAACWATDLGLGMTVVRAIEPPPMPAGVAIAAVPPVTPLTLAERKAEAAGTLQLLLEEIAGIAPDDLQAHVVAGRPGRRLSALAAEDRAALVVVGQRSHGALYEAVFGSPVPHLLRRSASPVMICPRTTAALAAHALPGAAPVR